MAERGKNTGGKGRQKPVVVPDMGRLQPQARELEEAGLGALMLEKDAYCNDILIQSAAVSAAMNAFNRELLSSHIHSCVVRDIREGKDEVVDELMATLQKLMK